VLAVDLSCPPDHDIRTKEAICTSDKHVDEARGRLKEAAGSLTDDGSLKRQGKVDRGKASIKDKVDKVADALNARDKEVAGAE
jgi:uncharacterized protein YjbJ (UPF0337 family)